ncbi:MAG: hypothetical protein E6Q60_00230 [Nitrosomonas oligotropha]|uniref:Uncharacterized protein n=1 Tax=Nitrosomonas oligotropha TaxID=42354 RepID=A0A5C7VZ76_9PROT|nr:MAG: hypothetical protein E6Q60_00230 [Nitrosomonas oligotropha]
MISKQQSSFNSPGNYPPLPDILPFNVTTSEDDPLVVNPRLPELVGEIIRPPIRIRSLRCGCYLMNYTPSSGGLISYDGTIRVECHSAGRTASGDLYQRPIIFLPPIILPRFPSVPIVRPKAVLASGPKPAAGIPILSRGSYRYYLRITQILEYFTFANGFTLGFEMHRFTKAAGAWSTGGTWTNEGAYTAVMTWQTAPTGYPSSSDYLEGDVKNSSGTVIGRLKMGWISTHLRKATVEIDRVSQSEAPLNNGAGVDWVSIGNGIGWQITVDNSDSNVAEPSGESWSDAECHAAMLARRDASNLDAEWRYHVLAVRRLDSTSRGIMYDADGGDSNNIPREGCSLSSHWVTPNTAEWGLVRNMRFGLATMPYFRTAVHETGHAMGLYHNTADNGFMNTTDVIASNSLTPGSTQFPNNVQWSYNSEDAKRLRHMPDIYVRPGSLPFGTSYASTPISPTDFSANADGFALRITPLLEAVPLGAPVRVNIELVNVTESTTLVAPKKLSMKLGNIRGLVTDVGGNSRTFRSLMLCVDDHELTLLKPGERVHHAATLLRGAEGALFPSAGVHQIIVEASWDMDDGMEAIVTGTCNVMITAAVDEAHSCAALKVLSTPDTLLTLALGGDHLTHGIEAIQVALTNPVLRPHFAYIEAKRVAQRFGKRKANLKLASELIGDDTIMSLSEIKKAAELFKTEGADSNQRKAVAKTLKGKIGKIRSSGHINDLIESL